jgi:PAS domain S-box-containing protein
MTNVAERNHRVLVIDDTESIHQDFRTILCRKNGNAELDSLGAALFGESSPAAPPAAAGFEVDSAHQGQEGLAKVKRALEQGRPYALAFVDIRMPPGWDGVETLRRIWDIDADLRAVICSAYSDYSHEALTDKLRRTDRLLILTKPFGPMVVRQLAANLAESWSRACEERRLVAAVMASETKYRSAIEAAPFGLLIHDASGSVTDCNSAACRLFGGAKEQLVGRPMKACFTPDLRLPATPEDGRSGAVRAACSRLDGSRFQADITFRSPVTGGAPVSMIYVHEVE